MLANDPAFPMISNYSYISPGMTYREYAAVQIMAQLVQRGDHSGHAAASAAAAAVKWAEALCAALEPKPTLSTAQQLKEDDVLDLDAIAVTEGKQPK